MRGLVMLVSIAVCMVCGGCSEAPATRQASPHLACRTLAVVPGPQDLVHDRSGPGRRLLVSSQERRIEPAPRGQIYAVPLDAGGRPPAARPLLVAGRGGCSFHPRGLSLVEATADRPALLYVVNDHDAADATPRTGCLPGAGEPERYRKPFSSVEVFAVEPDRLRFLQRLVPPVSPTRVGDLVALPRGDVYMTMPPRSGWRVDWELRWGNKGSRLARFACTRREGPLCRAGRWETVPLGRYIHGIAYREDDRELWVTSVFDDCLHLVPLDRAGRIDREDTGRGCSVPAGVHSSSWADEESGVLLGAVSAGARRHLPRSVHRQVVSPGGLWAISDRRAGLRARPVLAGSDRLVNAVSAALCLDGDLVVTDPIAAAVWRCPGGEVCPDHGPAGPTVGEEEPS